MLSLIMQVLSRGISFFKYNLGFYQNLLYILTLKATSSINVSCATSLLLD